MQITFIKQKLSLTTVLHHYGLTPDLANRLLCPFHADKNTKSLQLYPKTNTFFCFGCNKTGDVIDFIMFMEGCNKQTAINKAIALIGNGTHKIDNEARIIEKPVNNDYTKVFKTLRNNIFYYPQAQNYCNNRKINYIKYEIGYNPGNTFDKLKYCIVFPLKDKNNTITGLYGRSTINNESAKHFYTANRTGLYPGWPQQSTEILILTEAIIDLLGINELGNINCMASLALFGTNGLTPEHKEAITSLPNLKEIILFFDGDQAGRTATKAHAVILQTLCPKATIKTVATPDNEDINSILVKHGKEKIMNLLSSATHFQISPFSNFQINSFSN